jgi:hypothetical protein
MWVNEEKTFCPNLSERFDFGTCVQTKVRRQFISLIWHRVWVRNTIYVFAFIVISASSRVTRLGEFSPIERLGR